MKSLVILLIALLLISCDPGYAYLIKNNTEKNITVFAEPPIKTWENPLSPKEHHSVIIKPQETFHIFGSIGSGGAEDSFPFQKIVIRKENDSILLRNKSEINQKFNLNRKRKLFGTSYTIFVN